MKGENMKAGYRVLIFILIAVVFLAGCVGENKNTSVTPTQTTTPTVVTSGITVPLTAITTIPVTAIVSTPDQEYKTADIMLTPGPRPAYGFKMDYPTEWIYLPLHPENMKAGYMFMQNGGSVSSPKFSVQVNFNDLSGSSRSYEPINTWANHTIESMKDNGFFLISNDPANIPSTIEARKLVFSNGAIGQKKTIFLMYSGQMQGYNWTIPNHRDVAVKVDGPVWDYGIGGQEYEIEFNSLQDQINKSSNIFDHMINSFEVTTKL